MLHIPKNRNNGNNCSQMEIILNFAHVNMLMLQFLVFVC